jgi:hypothetical protein
MTAAISQQEGITKFGELTDLLGSFGMKSDPEIQLLKSLQQLGIPLLLT